MTDDRTLRQARVFERFWDALVSGRTAASSDELEPDVVEIARRLGALSRPIATDKTFESRLWEELMQTHALDATVPLRPTTISHPNGRSSNGRAPGRASAAIQTVNPSARSRAQRRVGAGLTWLASAALVAAVLALALFLSPNDQRAVIVFQETPGAVGTPMTEATPAVEDWPMYRGNPGRTGNLPVHGPEGVPVEAWTFQAEGRIDAAPVVVGGVVYLPSEDGNLYAFDAATGAATWQVALDAGSGSSLVVDGSVIYVTDNTHALYALDSATGEQRWRVEGVGQNDPGPVVDGLVYASGEDGGLHALEATSGEELWSIPLDGGPSRAAAVADGIVVVGSNDGHVNALDAATGALRWSVDVGGGTVGTPAILDGVVYASSFGGPDNKLMALAAADGAIDWTFQTPQKADLRSPAIGDGVVYTVSGDGNLYALESATGIQRFTVQTGGPISAAPALASGVVYLVSKDGTVYAVDGADGHEVWRFDIAASSDYGPVVADGMVYLATDPGKVIAIRGEPSTTSETPAAGSEESSTALTAPTLVPVATTFPTPPSSVAPLAGVEVVATYLGDAATPLNGPEGMALDASGNLYVVDSMNARIVVFGPDGAAIDAFGEPGDGPGQFKFWDGSGFFLGAVAIGPDGSIYVADALNDRVQKFTADHTFALAWGETGTGSGQFQATVDIAVDADGNVYVTDLYNDRVQVFDPDGTYLDKWGTKGTRPGQLSEPLCIAVSPDGLLYVSEQANNRVQWFDSGGVSFGSIGSFGTGPSQFNVPAGLAFDPAGNLYVADYKNGRVQVFGPDGAVMAIVSDLGGDAGSLNLPSYVEVHPAGEFFYISDEGNNRVVKIRLTSILSPGDGSSAATPIASPVAAEPVTAEFVWASSGSETDKLLEPQFARLSPDGKLYVTSQPGQIFIFDLDGTLLEVWGEPGEFRFTDGTFVAGTLTFASDGSIYVVDPFNYRVEHYSADRTLLGTFGAHGDGNGQFVLPVALAIEPGGTLLVSDYLRDDVQRFAADGTFREAFDAAGTVDGVLQGPAGVTVDEDGLISVAEVDGNRVRIFSESWEPLGELGADGPDFGGFLYPGDIAIDDGGYRYVADGNNNRIVVFDAEGRFIFEFGDFGSGDGQMNGVVAVAVGPDGSAYVVDWHNNRIQRWQVTGLSPEPASTPPAEATSIASPVADRPATVDVVWASSGSETDRLLQPTSATVAPDGNVWVTSMPGQIFIFDPEGVLLEVWGAPGEFLFSDGGLSLGTITYAPDGSFYVCDARNARVKHYDANRKSIGEFGSKGTGDGQLLETSYLAIAADGTLLVSDSDRGVLQRFTPDGSFLGAFNAVGPTEDPATTAFGVDTTSDGRILVSEGATGRVRVFQADGAYAGELGADGSIVGGLSFPTDIAVDSYGYIYVTDFVTNRVVVLDLDGRFVLEIGEFGMGDGQLNGPSGVAVGSDGAVYVTRFHDGRVQKFTIDGAFPTVEATPQASRRLLVEQSTASLRLDAGRASRHVGPGRLSANVLV